MFCLDVYRPDLLPFLGGNFPIFRISGGDLRQHLLEKFSIKSWIRTGVVSCAPHTSFDEINDSIVKSERGELVMGANPPLAYIQFSHYSRWRADQDS